MKLRANQVWGLPDPKTWVRVTVLWENGGITVEPFGDYKRYGAVKDFIARVKENAWMLIFDPYESYDEDKRKQRAIELET